MKCLGKISRKPYKCRECGKKREGETNHWGAIYNIFCSHCQKLTTWDCEEEPPEGYGLPVEWQTAKLGDIAEIKET